MKIQKNKILLLLGIILLVAGTLYAQTGTTGRGRTRAPATHQLTVNANVSNFQVLIDGDVIKGNRIELEAGTYNVVVKAGGYFDWQQSVELSADRTLTANLQPEEYQLSVNANIKGARVFVNDNQQGSTDYTGRLTPGTYNIRITQPGYKDFTTSVNLNQNRVVNATLEPNYAQVQVNIPAEMLNPRDKAARNKIEVYVNGTQQSSLNFQLMPGEHNIQIVSGGLAVEQRFAFQPGVSYIIEPSFGLTIK